MAHLIPPYIAEPVVRIETTAGRGTAFTLEWDDKLYLVSAHHIVGADPIDATVTVGGSETSVHLQPLARSNEGADIAVAPLQQPLTPPLDATPTLDGMIDSQDVFFLGFPNGVDPGTGAGAPFARKGILSATTTDQLGAHLLYIDAFNDHGFAGGPLVFFNIETGQPCIGGVISTEQVPANAGIVIAGDIKHAIDALPAP